MEVAVVEEVVVSCALIEAAVLMQESELTQEEIAEQSIHQWVVTEHARQQKEAATCPRSPSKDFTKIMKELEAIPVLIVGDMDEEQYDDKCMLTALNKLKGEAAVAKRHAILKARTNMEQLQKKQDQLARIDAAVAQQKKRREEEQLL
jgi:hypothetical protein